MARLSKAQPFEVYDDSRTSTSTSTTPILPRSTGSGMTPRSKPQSPRPGLDRQDSKYESFPASPIYSAVINEDPDFQTVNEANEDNEDNDDRDNGDDADDDRRESTFTSTSISTMPESIIHTDNEAPFAAYRPYTPPSVRPTFRRAESVRRMQMTSPTPFDRSPRRSVLTRSRPGTPRSVRSIKSPKTRRRIEEEQEEERQAELAARLAARIDATAGNDDDDDEERRDFPLVLLHLTLLPVELPWSAASMDAVLPRPIRDNLQLLRAKVSDTILQRGILIPHPREDYELLEERLLEALELRAERVTKCGHFRARGSVSTISSLSGDGSVDSGLGSSLEGSDNELCEVCCHRVKTSKSGVGAGGQRWMVKVFAANGLMRAPAWAAAWPEMERVDVEILPWIGDEFRKMLDARAAEEEAEERRRSEEDRGYVQTAGELTWVPDPDMTVVPHAEEQEVLDRFEVSLGAEVVARIVSASGQYSASPSSEPGPHQNVSAKAPSDLPPIYRPSEIPLSLLLRNYVFLLAQDARNVAIFALTMIALWLSLRSAFESASPATITPTLEICPQASGTKATFNATMELPSQPAGMVEDTSPARDILSAEFELPQPELPADETYATVDSVSEEEIPDSRTGLN